MEGPLASSPAALPLPLECSKRATSSMSCSCCPLPCVRLAQAALRAEKDKQVSEKNAFMKLLAQRKAAAVQDATMKRMAERAYAGRARSQLEKRESRGSEQPRLWPVSAPVKKKAGHEPSTVLVTRV